MRVLWTLPYLPWPITSGGKSRQYNLLRQLAGRGHRITLLVQSKTPADDSVRAAIEPLVERLIVLPRRPLRHPRSLWLAAASPLPLLTSVNGYAPALEACFADLLSEDWDAVQIEHSYGLQPFLRALTRRSQPFALTEHNVESDLGAATYDKWPAPLRVLVGYDRWRARRWEQRVLPQASALVAVTAEDARVLGPMTGRPAWVVPNGVDTAAFAQVQPDFASQRVLFVGNFEYAPNIDALQWACTDIWPRLWQQMPQARFVVCGHALPDALRKRFADPRIEWQGYVPDLTQVQGSCAAFLAPLRAGGGSKLKVLEALAAGLAVVSTSEGLSGLGMTTQVEPRACCANDAAGLAHALARTLREPATAARLGAAGRQHVQAHFDWSAAAAQLEAVWRTLAATRRGSVLGSAASAPATSSQASERRACA